MKSSRSVRILAGVFTILYLLLFFIEPLIGGQKLEWGVYALGLIFLAAFIISFKNVIVAGYLFLVWLVLIWIFGFFVFPGAGMALLLSSPILLVGVLLIRNGQINSGVLDTKAKRWKYVLQWILVIYTVLYLVSVTYEFTNPNRLDFSSSPGTVMLGALILFLIGFFTSWKRELIAGIIFILWYLIIIYSWFQYFEFANRGPWVVFGVTVLIHGLLYLFYFFRIKDSRS